MELKNTPLVEEHKKLGATLVDFGGWNMPVQYTNVIEEHNITRNNAGLFDISHMGEIFVEGKQAVELLQKTMSRDISKIKEGKMVLAVICNNNGGILDDLTIYKFNEEKFMLVVNASNELKDFEWIKKTQKEQGFDAIVSNKSSEFAKLDFQGPKSQEILQKITNFDLNEIGFYEFKEGLVDGIKAIISRSGYTGEQGFELYFDWNSAPQIWNKILELGKNEGIKAIGLGARDTLRLECAMNLYGHEMDESKSPIQCRYGWVVNYDKEFIGKKAILKQKEEGIKEKLAGFELIDRGIARHGYKLFKNREEIGVVTSGTLSPTLKKALGLCYIKSDFAQIDTEFEVEIREKKYKAKIVKLPFYKREKEE
ncbi:MAG: glycine cleavage system aminomethyltransferase GcvT [Candidatus Diapherotrites archaeon]